MRQHLKNNKLTLEELKEFNELNRGLREQKT
jgi:hypothetical protein